MAVYQITAPDGSVYRITGPENARQEDLIRAVRRQTQQDKYAQMQAEIDTLRQPTPEAPKEPTLGGEFKEFGKGIIPGAAGLAETAGAGIAALLPEDLEKSARAKLRDIVKSVSDPFAPEPGYEDSIGRNLGQGLGSTVPFFALGALGPLARLASVGLAGAAGAGEARQGAEAKGATGEERSVATALGIGPGLIDVVAPEFKVAGNILKRAFLKGGVEGVTEAAQKVAQNLIAKGIYDPSQPILAGSGEEGAYGAGVGALASLLVDMTIGRRTRGGGRDIGQQPPGGAEPPSGTQGDLFPSELRTAETAAMPPAPPPSGTQGDLFTPEAAPVPEPTAEQPAPQEGQMDMFAPSPAEETRPTEQRDMVNEAETAQIEDMLRADKIAPVVGASNDAEIERLREAGAATKETERLKFESDLAELGGKLNATETKTSEDARLALLLPIIEDAQVKNIPGEFKGALLGAGYTDTQFTPREQNLIQRAYDVRTAEPVEPKVEVEPSAPATETAAQLVPAATEEAPEAPAPLTAKHFDILGITKAAPLRQRLDGRDFSVAADRELIRQEFDQYMQNPKIAAATRTKLQNLLASPLFRTQEEMFGPKGGVLKPAAAKETKNVPDTKPEPTATGASVPSTGRKLDSGAGRTTTPAVAGVGGANKPTRGADAGEKTQPAALKEEKPSKPKEAKPTETKEEKPTAAKSPVQEQATKNYMAAAKNDKAKAIDYLAGDLYNATYPQKNVSAELKRITSALLAGKMPQLKFGTEEAHAPGTGGKYAKAFSESLSPADQTALIKQLEHYFVTTETNAANALAQMNAPQSLATANKEQFDDVNDLFALSVSVDGLTRALHPAAVDALARGDLIEALQIVAKQGLGRASNITSKLADAMGKTKVEVVKKLKNESGQEVAGMYDPKSDTLYTHADLGSNIHTLLHEATHAATSHVLANKSHPVTKQLTQLYNDVKGWLDTAYGATSLDEFVSEAMSNPEFQAKLQAINPKGDKTTAWQRFLNTVGNFLRRMVGIDNKPLGSALDTTDRLVMSILSPAPGKRNAGVLLSASAIGNSGQVYKAVDKSYLNSPKLQENIDGISEFLFGTVSDKVKDIVRSALPLHALVDVAKTYVPKAPLVDKLIAERSGNESLRNRSIEPVLIKVEAWASKNPNKLDAFNATVYDSTLAQVDPTKLRDTYKEPEQKKEWDAMQANLKAIEPEGAALYKTMRDTYKKLYGEMIRIVNARIDAATDDKDRAKAIKTEIYSRLTARGGLDPYFPLTREGQYWLSYHAKNPRTNTTELYVEAFETKRGRERAIEEYESNGATNISKFANLASINYRNAPPTSFINGVLKTLEANKVNPEVAEEVMRFFLATLPETSFAKAFQSRKGTLGFKQDAVRALRQKTMSISRQLANMEYGAKLSQLRADIEEDFKASGQKEDAKPYVDALNEHIKFAISPQIPKWAKLARSFGFNMTLGFNVSSAVVNIAQVPLIVAPYLGGKYGVLSTTKAIAHATRIYTQSGFQREVKTFVPVDGKEKTTVKAAPSLDNYDFDAKNAPEDVKRLKVLSDVAGKLGQLNRSQLYDVLDVSDPKNSVLDRINAASGFVFHHGERTNRQITMIAAYTLELDKMKADGRTINEAAMTEAAETAVYMTEMVNGGTSAAGAPRLAQSGLGSVLFMFKRYGVSMYYLLFKTARDALKGADKQTRTAAMRQIAGIYGSAALFAGARGLPMFGMVSMLYNMFKDDDEDDFAVATRKFLGEGVYSGAINATTGLDVASRIGLSDLIFRDQSYSESTSVIAALAETMGGPVFGVASRVERGLKLISEGNTDRGIESILPSAIANMFRANRYASEGVTTLRGDPITGDVNSWNVFAQAFGFAPAEYTRQLAINATVKGIDKKTNEKKTKLLKQFYTATRFGDTPTAQEAIQELLKLQKKHPGLGISADTIINSMRQHAKTSATMYHGITLSKGMRGELLQNAREFDEGYGDTYDDVINPFAED